MAALAHGKMLPLDQLFRGTSSDLAGDREFASRFYASSWALVRLLLESSAYTAWDGPALDSIAAGNSVGDALTEGGHRTGQQLLRDAIAWIQQPAVIRGNVITGFPAQPLAAHVLPELDAQLLLANLLLASGKISAAQERFQQLATRYPPCAECESALGQIAWNASAIQAHPANQDNTAAIEHWRRALEAGLPDASLCYRLALATADLPALSSLTERALTRALALRPDFDDARYKLALLKRNQGEYATAAALLREMNTVPRDRAFAYWTALSDSLEQTADHAGAEQAAQQAAAFAQSPNQRAAAHNLLLFARTELHVQVVDTGNGTTQVVTTRVPRGASGFNPFVEPGDHVQDAEGILTEVACQQGAPVSLTVLSAGRSLQIAIPHPDRVLVEPDSAKFFCGSQPSPSRVRVTYAAGSANQLLVRGISFVTPSP